MSETRPSWQQTPCPHWCTQDHEEADFRGDRVHASEHSSIPVIARHSGLECGRRVVHDVVASEYNLELRQVDGEEEIWVFLGVGAGESIEISLESARRVLNEWQRRMPST